MASSKAASMSARTSATHAGENAPLSAAIPSVYRLLATSSTSNLVLVPVVMAFLRVTSGT